MEGRARFSKLAVPYLDRLPEGVFQTLMYHALAERTGIDVESLKRLQPPPAPRPDPADSAPPLMPRPRRRLILQNYPPKQTYRPMSPSWRASRRARSIPYIDYSAW